jgi:hypothetical protein
MCIIFHLPAAYEVEPCSLMAHLPNGKARSIGSWDPPDAAKPASDKAGPYILDRQKLLGQSLHLSWPIEPDFLRTKRRGLREMELTSQGVR